MKIFNTFSIGKLHEQIVDYIYKHGYSVITENGEHTLEFEPVTLVTKTPMDDYRISKYSSFKKPFMDEYTNKLLNGCAGDFTYDYHTRLYNYNGVNQIDYIVNKLSDEPNSRRAQAITWNPLTDTTMNDCPCLQYVQAHIVNNKLDMTVMFRSNDMLLAFGSNAYALTMLQKEIADRLELDVGTYRHISLIPHIYDIRDKSDLEKFVIS